MKLSPHLALFTATLLLAPAAHAGPAEVAQSAAAGASRVAHKTEKAVVHGVKVAASGVAKGAHAAGRAADNVARKAGLQPGTPGSGPGAAGPR